MLPGDDEHDPAAVEAHDSNSGSTIVADIVGEEGVVAWPLLVRHRLHRRVRRSDRYRTFVLAAVLTGVFATGFAITVLGTSVGTIAGDFGTSTSTMTWIVTGPLLGPALATPLCGKLGDLFGHRQVYVGGLLAFTFFALITVFAWDPLSLIAFRTLSAVAGSATVPSSMALIMVAFDEDERFRAMGWWSLVGAGAPVIGLVAGGPIVEQFGWRWIFVAQVPIGLAALAIAVVVLRETDRRPRVPIDVAGALYLAAACVALLFGLNRGAEWGWASPGVILLFVAVPVVLILFVRHERRVLDPILPLRFFALRNFRASLVAQFGANFAYMGGFIVTPILLTDRFGWTLTAASLAMIVRPLTFSLSSPSGGSIALRVGERTMAVAGTGFVVLSMTVLLMAAPTGAVAFVFVGMICSGLGLGFAMPSLLTTVANTVPPADLGVANAAQTMVMQIGTAAGVQTLATVQGAFVGNRGFTAAYALGAVAAGVGVIGALGVRSRTRRSGSPQLGAPTARRFE